MIDLKELTIKKAHEHLVNGDFSAKEITENYLKNVEEKNSDINAYLEIFDDAMAQAEEADKIIKTKGKNTHALTGIPLAIKDNILIKGRTASCGSKILENYKAVYDATVIKKLKVVNAVFLGRANMDEFAMGSSGENSAFGPTKNPLDESRVPGGSSSGPAAAVAMSGALTSLGSDTGCSVRLPASFCGLVGLKPTYGAVSRCGLVAMASSLDQIGPITKTVEDSEIVFNTIKGLDIMDSTSSPDSDKKEIASTRKQYSIGVPANVFEDIEGIDDDVREQFFKALDILKSLGHKVKNIKIPYITYSLPVYYIITPAEVSANLARFDGMRYGLHVEGEDLFTDYAYTRGKGFGAEVRRRILLGTYVLSAGYYDAYYNKAVAVRQRIVSDFKEAFSDVDIITMPTTPTPAFKLGEKTDNPLAMYLSDIFTAPANIAGIPAISIPSGTVERDGKSLPLGLQLIAPHFQESVLFDAARQFEEVREG